MLICMSELTYFKIHKHPRGFTESYHVIEGTLKVFFFDDGLNLISSLVLSPEENFIYRLNKSVYHLVISTTASTIYHETLCGPFERGKSVIIHPESPKTLSEAKKLIRS